MNAVTIIQMVLQIISLVQPVLQPLEAAGIQAVVTAIQQHQAQGKKLSLKDIHAIGVENNVNMNAIYAKAGVMGAMVIALAAFAIRKAVRK